MLSERMRLAMGEYKRMPLLMVKILLVDGEMQFIILQLTTSSSSRGDALWVMVFCVSTVRLAHGITRTSCRLAPMADSFEQ